MSETQPGSAIMASYSDLPEAVRYHLASLEIFIGDMGDLELRNGDVIDSSVLVPAFNGIVAALRATPAQPAGMREALATALARRLCQLFDSGGESQRSVRARHASAIFQLLNRDAPEYLAEQRWCDASPISYLERGEAMALTLPAERPANAQAEWMPIETAPKGGKRILLYQAGRGAFEGWWHTAWPHPEEYWMDDADSEPDPSHWRPTLPLPSTEGESLRFFSLPDRPICPHCNGMGRRGVMACNPCGATGVAHPPAHRNTEAK